MFDNFPTQSQTHMSIYPHCPSLFCLWLQKRKGGISRIMETLHAQKRITEVLFCWRKGGFPPPQSSTVPTWSEKNGKNCIRDIQNHLLSISLIVIKYKITCKKCFSDKKKGGGGGLNLVHSERGCRWRWLLQTPTRNCSPRTEFDTRYYPQSRKY